MRFLEMHIEVEDVEKSVSFYSTLLPHQRVGRWSDGNVAAIVLPDGSAFGIWKHGTHGLFNGQAGKHVHFALWVDETEYEQVKARLNELGLESFEHRWPKGGRSIYFFDPDGHQGEFMTVDWTGI